MSWLREIERAFRSFILKFSKSLCSKCLLWTTRSLQAKVWQERTVGWEEKVWKGDKWGKEDKCCARCWNLTTVLGSVLSLSRRFLKVFLRPRNFGFSSLAGGWRFFWTWTAPLFTIRDGQQGGKNMIHINEVIWGGCGSVDLSFTLLYFLLLILERSVSFTTEGTHFSSSTTNCSILLSGTSVQGSYPCVAAFFFADLSLFFLLLLLTFTVVDEAELKIHLCLQAGGYTNRHVSISHKLLYLWRCSTKPAPPATN